MISLVIPIYNEEALLEDLNAELHRVMRETGEAWEVVYVDDGSADRSVEILSKLQRTYPDHVVVVELSRNWGHQAAITAGLTTARGDAVVVMDGDFQDPPYLLPQFIAAWRDGAEVVVGKRSSRGERGLRGMLFPLFYRTLGFLSDYPIPLNVGIFGLMDRKVCDAILRMHETNRFLPGLRWWVGFRVSYVEFDRPDRAAGGPKQTLGRLFKYGMDAILSFSYKPLRLGLALGLASAAVSLVAASTLITLRVFRLGIFKEDVVLGYTSLMCAILFVGSIQMICVGILGEYLGRIYDEVKRRPFFVVRSIHKG
ncbi:MAG: glycosyltransferase family 2 protein [Bryobacteraceae bacterium]